MAEERAAAEKWQETTAESRWIWTEYQRKWPPAERPVVDRSKDPPGSWRGERGRSLDNADNSRIEAECDHIARREEERISPAMRSIESQDPDRQLVGFEHRLKDRDRIKEKVYDKMEEFSWSAEEAVSAVSDTIRYTFQYRESRYTQGVWTDLERLKGEGFKLHQLKNSWSDEEYKGINSQWIEPDTGQRFEVQFHTGISFEAKQLTHDSYERLRTQQADEFEKMVPGSLPGEGQQPRCRFRLALPTFPTTRREVQVPDKVIYYAVVNDLSSRDRPAGLFRRTYTEDGGRSDEAFTRNLRWEYSTVTYLRRARRP